MTISEGVEPSCFESGKFHRSYTNPMTLDNHQNAKVINDYAGYLIDITAKILCTIQNELFMRGVVDGSFILQDLRYFATAVFRHSKISYSVLLTGLRYLLRLRDSYMHNPKNPSKFPFTQNMILILFVVSLILATKFIHDRHTTNSTWCLFTGLTLQEINQGEIYFLNSIQHEVRVDKNEFEQWTSRLFQEKFLRQYRNDLDRKIQREHKVNYQYSIDLKRMRDQRWHSFNYLENAVKDSN